MPEKPVPIKVRMRPLKVPGSIFVSVSNANDAATIARMQGISRVKSIDDLVADFWPEDESVDEFIETLRQLSREDHYV